MQQGMLAILVIALSLGAIVGTLKLTKNADARWKKILRRIAIGLIIIANLDIVQTTEMVENRLAPLRAEFEEVTKAGPSHTFAREERGSYWSFDGQLDNIIERRNLVVHDLDVIGESEWRTSGDGNSFAGIYFHGSILLVLLVLWTIDVLCIRYINKRETAGSSTVRYQFRHNGNAH